MREADGVGAAFQPRAAVPGQHDSHVGGGEVVQGPPVQLDVSGGSWRHHAWPCSSRVGIQGDQRVTAQQYVPVRQQE